MRNKLDDEGSPAVTCPYCGEEIEIHLEPEMSGAFVQDCEVCCNPLQLRLVRDGADRYLEVSRADGSE
jgi:Cysteine-rich CPXCG